MLNLNEHTKAKPKLRLNFKNCLRLCVSLCITVVHNTLEHSTAHNNSDRPNLLSIIMIQREMRNRGSVAYITT